MVTIPGLENINWAAGLGTAMYYIGYGLMIIFIFAVIFAVYYFMGFTIKAHVTPIYGSGDKGLLSFGKSKSNRFKWIKNRTAWKPLHPFMSKIEIEPFDAELIYPGNHVVAFKYGDHFIPGRYTVEGKTDNLKASVSPVPYYIRNWQSLQHKKNSQEFAENNFWEQNKYFIMGVVTVAICCAVALGTVWLTYKFAGGGRADISALTEAIKGFGAIPGK